MKVTQKHRMIMFLHTHTHTHTHTHRHTHTQRHLLLSAGWFHSLSLKTFSIWWENGNTQGVLGNGLLSHISQNLVNKYHSLDSPETLREQICHVYTFFSASAAHSETQAKLIKWASSYAITIRTWVDICSVLSIANSGVCCCCSVTQSCLTLADPTVCSMPGFPVPHYFSEFAQTHVHWVSDAIQPSHPLSPPYTPVLTLSQHQGLFQWLDSSILRLKIYIFISNFHEYPED